MVSDSELVNRLHELLRTADLDNTTTTSVRRTLEKDLGIDLSDRKAFIREKVDLFLESGDGKIDDLPNEDAVDNDDGSEEQVADEEADDGDGDSEEEETDGESNGKRPEKSDKAVKKVGRGYSKPCALSPQLQKLVGEPEMARTEVVKKIWVYIKEKNLQKPSDKRIILCDEILHDIFRVKSINMFQMNKVLTKHIWPLDEEEAPIKPSKKKRRSREDTEEEEEAAPIKPSKKKRRNRKDSEDEEEAPVKPSKKKRRSREDSEEEEEEAPVKPSKKKRRSRQDSEEEEEAPVKPSKKKRQDREDTKEEGDSDAPKGKNKQVKGKGSVFRSPLPISDALGNFFETDDRALSRAEVIKRMWDYIKRNNLQDPSNRRRILCDDKLKELFEVDSFIGFTVSKLLKPHFIKDE